MIEKAIEKLSKSFRLEQRVESSEEELTLVTETYIRDKVVYTHHLDLLPLLEELKKRL